ncbi:hypothetical protein JST99_03900 [Candidatus Dependentiae bacterium]|nr:hypothetical protein [Candidatus Dependentiae bacterium]MCC7415368.1 hypothetical protein [Campylobacterota bacterium]
MELNITLVVQAINFLCAYYILRYGFFSYAVAAAQADKEYTDSLLSAIADRTVILEQKRFEQEEHWKACQYKLAQHEPCQRPHLQQAYNSDIVPPLHVPTLSDNDITQAVAQAAAALQKIGDRA